MPRVFLDAAQAALLVIDVQPSLTPHILDGGRVLERIAFLAEIASLLEIPVLATEQNPSKMGFTEPSLARHFSGGAFEKMSFSAAGCATFMEALRASGRTQVVIVGFETHICVSLTAQDLLEQGFEVVVCPDGVSSRNQERHKLGMERIRDAGVVPAHTEAVAYEWLGSAAHPKFREALAVVKRYA